MIRQKPNRIFTDLLEEHQRIIFKVAHAYCGRPDDFEDLCQEIVLNLWQSFPKFNDQYKFSTWMYRVSLNVAISHLRREGIRKTEPLDEDYPDQFNPGILLSDDKIKLLHHFINQLDELERALMLLYLEGLDYKSIAHIMGITETNVATKLNRAKKKLQKNIDRVESKKRSRNHAIR